VRRSLLAKFGAKKIAAISFTRQMAAKFAMIAYVKERAFFNASWHYAFRRRSSVRSLCQGKMRSLVNRQLFAEVMFSVTFTVT
jgi:hypothetical protein